jgi:hypothetical protein
MSILPETDAVMDEALITPRQLHRIMTKLLALEAENRTLKTLITFQAKNDPAKVAAETFTEI